MRCCDCVLWSPTDEDVGECMLSYVETYACHQCKNGVDVDE